MKISVLIPVYNEEKTVALIIESVKKLRPLYSLEIVAVDDGSTDNSAKVIRKHDVRLIQHKRNMGKGAAIRTGLENSTGDIVVIQDADLEYDPQFIPKLVEPIIAKKTQVVYGSRFKGKCKGMKIKNRLGNIILSSAVSLLFKTKITDMMTGYKAFRKDVLGDINLTSRGFEFEPEVTAKIISKGVKILEVPIGYEAREIGKKIRWTDGLKSLITLLNVYLKNLRKQDSNNLKCQKNEVQCCY